MIPHRADGGQVVRASSAHPTAWREEQFARLMRRPAGCRRTRRRAGVSVHSSISLTASDDPGRGRVMNHADGLVANVLERPADPAPWLILADWLEEQGGPDDLARA